MLTRRKALGAVAAAVAAACAPRARAFWPLGGSAAGSAPVTFNYYISPTGSNTNAGTLEAPFSITALNSNSTLAGKNIGIIGDQGPYNVASIVAGGSWSAPPIDIYGSTSAPTYIASCNSSGVYSPRLAVLDAHAIQNPITDIVSSGSNTVFTVNSSASSNPYTVGQPFVCYGIGGMTQLNGYMGGTSGVPATIQSLGGSVGAWTVTVNINSSGFSAYTSGGYLSSQYPTTQSGTLGQHSAYIGTEYQGNVTLDGLVLTGNNAYIVVWYGTGSGEGGTTGFTIQNCEFFDMYQSSGNNCTAVLEYNTTGSVLNNCKIHDLYCYAAESPGSGGTVSGSPSNDFDAGAIVLFACHGHITKYCTAFNINTAWWAKNSGGNHTWAYNVAQAGPYSVYLMQNALEGEAGDTESVYGDIFILPFACAAWNGSQSASSNPASSSPLVYNNTIISSVTDCSGFYVDTYGSNVSPSAETTHYNNLYAFADDPNGSGLVVFCSGTIALSDYNCYMAAAASTAMLGLAPTSSPASPTQYTLANFQTETDTDAHSSAGTPTFVNGSATYLDPAGYQLQTGSFGKGAGSTNGMTSGSACDVGAWGGASPPSQIGCNFVNYGA